jgi:branched-chain amino acid transport system substrate-binding protein
LEQIRKTVIFPAGHRRRMSVDRRRFLETAGVLGTAGVSAGCLDIVGAPTRERATGPLTIGASLPFSGFMSTEGPELYLGMEFWREAVNEDGGLLGRPVEFVVYDDGSTAEGAAAAYRKLLDEDDVDLLLGTGGSIGTSGAIEVLEARGRPCLFPMSSGPIAWDVEREWTVPLIPIAGEVARGMVAVLAALGVETFAVISASSGYASSLTAGLNAHLGRAGIDVVEEAVYPRNEPAEREAALASVVDAGADAIGAGGSVSAVKPLVRSIGELDVDATAFAWFDFDDSRVLPLAAQAEGMLGTGMWAAEVPFAGRGRFVERFSTWAQRRKPNWSMQRILQHHSPAAYGGARVFQQAVEQAGTTDPAPVRDALWDIETSTPFGRYAVDDDGYQVGKEMFVLQYRRGLREVVWPERLRTAEPRLPTVPSTSPG